MRILDRRIESSDGAGESQPQDSDSRAATYPDVAHQTYEEMGKAFDGLFNDPDTPTDPVMVVDRMIELIEMKAGTRPYRNVVGIDFGVGEINAAAEPHEATALEAMGLTSFATNLAGSK